MTNVIIPKDNIRKDLIFDENSNKITALFT